MFTSGNSCTKKIRDKLSTVYTCKIILDRCLFSVVNNLIMICGVLSCSAAVIFDMDLIVMGTLVLIRTVGLTSCLLLSKNSD